MANMVTDVESKLVIKYAWLCSTCDYIYDLSMA